MNLISILPSPRTIKGINQFDKKLSYPLLINPFQEYFDAKIKILFIGKETKYWILDAFIKDELNPDIVPKLMDNYKRFRFGENSNIIYKHNSKYFKND